MTLIASLASAGCGGGGSSVASSTAASPTGSFTASFTFALPSASAASASRKPSYISASSRSLVIDIVYRGATVPGLVLNLNPLPSTCTQGDGGVTCTASVIAQASVESFIVSFFDGANGQGHMLSTATVPAPPATNGVADVAVVLDGVVATVGLALNGLVYGVPGNGTLTVTPYDADGNVIGGSAPFNAPVGLSTSSMSLALSTATVTVPFQPVTVTYNGALDTTLKVIAQPQGSAPVILAPFGPTSTPPLTGVPPLTPALTQTGPATISVMEPGYRGAYTVASSNPQVITVTSPITSVSDTTAIPISALAAGTANVTVSDTNNQSVVFAVTVTLTPITIQGVRRR